MGDPGSVDPRTGSRVAPRTDPATRDRQWHSLRAANRVFMEADAHDLPNGKTVYHYFRRWKRDGSWQRAMTSLRREVRTRMGRDPEPSAAIIDSQSIKTSPVRGTERGFDAGKKNLRSQTASAGRHSGLAAGCQGARC